MTKGSNPSLFFTTRWSLVDRAASNSEDSLEALCQQYWHPVYVMARASGNDEETAKDLTQGFFAKLLEKQWLGTADREKGLFRTFLATALKRYMINEWRRDHAEKRGGFAEIISLDSDLPESLFARHEEISPDVMFDRQWALTLLDSALKRLQAEAGGDFEVLKDCLTAGRGEIDYPALAHDLGQSEGAARVAVHRLRKRYRAVIREEVARTVADEGDVDEEMQALMSALG